MLPCRVYLCCKLGVIPSCVFEFVDKDTFNTCNEELVLSIDEVCIIDKSDSTHVKSSHHIMQLIDEQHFELRCDHHIKSILVGEGHGCYSGMCLSEVAHLNRLQFRSICHRPKMDSLQVPSSINPVYTQTVT